MRGVSSRRLGKRTTDRGLATLEIALAGFLALVLGAAVFATHRKRARLGPMVACEQNRWRWTRLAEDLEWKIRRWEVFASLCLKGGFRPVSTDPATSEITVWEATSSRPLLIDMKGPGVAHVPPQHEFSVGQNVVLCSEEKYIFGQIRRVEMGQTASALQFDVTSEDPGGTLPRGALVVAAKMKRFKISPSENPPEKILYEKRSQTDQRPVEFGFEDFVVNTADDPGKNGLRVSIMLGRKECNVTRDFPVKFGSLQANPGRWWIQKNDLIFEPWLPGGPQGG